MVLKRVQLFDRPPTLWQVAVAGLWGVSLLAVLIIWVTTALLAGDSGLQGIVFAVGRLFGLLAVFFALVQFLLMGRVVWIERSFGLDRLAGFHRLNGYATISCIIAHSLLIVAAYSLTAGNNYIAQYLSILREFPYVWMAEVAQILFVTVVVSSVYIVRRKLRFESWYFVHMIVYAAIVLAFFHQFAIGGSFSSHPVARAYWYAMYAFVGVNVLFWRFSWPTINLLRFRFRVVEVAAETATSTSIYIAGRNLKRWRTRPGQFILARIFAPGLWWQEHPFSLSMMPTDDRLRLTVRKVGDYTEALSLLRPGAYVLLSGPFGRFTAAAAQTDKRLFIAGGVGITPIRTLAEEAVAAGKDSILLYASRSEDDTVLKTEIDQLTARGLHTTYLYADSGHLDGTKIFERVPDALDRDIYLCGPPPMMEAIISSLLERGVAEGRLHYERFSLHNQ